MDPVTGQAQRSMDVGRVYEQVPPAGNKPRGSVLGADGEQAVFAAELRQLADRQAGSPRQLVYTSLGSSLPMERVKAPYFHALGRSSATPGQVDAQAQQQSQGAAQPLPHTELLAELLKRGISVSSPWVLTVSSKPGQDVALGASSWATGDNKLSGSPVFFYQRSGTAPLAPEAVDALVKDALAWAAQDPGSRTPTDVARRLFDEQGLEMVLAQTDGLELTLYDYHAALHPTAPVATTRAELDAQLRSQRTERGELVRRQGTDKPLGKEQLAVKQMLLSADQFEAHRQRAGAEQQRPAAERRGLRNKVLRVVAMAGLARQDGAGQWQTTRLTNTLSPTQKQHFKALLAALEGYQFGTDFNAPLEGWFEDLFTYLNYLDGPAHADEARRGLVSQAWEQESEQHSNPIQLRLYAGSKDAHTVPFAQVLTPPGVRVRKLVGASRLTMTGLSPVVNLHRALQQGQATQAAAAAASSPSSGPVVTAPAPAITMPAPAVRAPAPTALAQRLQQKEQELRQLEARISEQQQAPARPVPALAYTQFTSARETPEIPARYVGSNPVPTLPLALTGDGQLGLNPQRNEQAMLGDGLSRSLGRYFDFVQPQLLPEPVAGVSLEQPGRLQLREDGWHLLEKGKVALIGKSGRLYYADYDFGAVRDARYARLEADRLRQEVDRQPVPAATPAATPAAAEAVVPASLVREATPAVTAALAPAVASTAVAVPASLAAPVTAERQTGRGRYRSVNLSHITQGDAQPAEAEARLRYLFGDELEFALNRGINFSRELGQMTGNLITLATDNGRDSGLVSGKTANHEAIHRVLRIVTPAYRQKLLAAHRAVLVAEQNSSYAPEQLADEDFVEEQLARYYEDADLRTYQQKAEKFRQNPVVKFLQGFGAGRVVLRGLQALSRAANELARNPDYLGELFTDMEKGYYQQRRVRQRYLEDKLNSRNGDSPRGRRQADLDSLAELFGGLDMLYGWQDRVKQEVYEDLFAFNPSRPRHGFASARAAYVNDARLNAQDVAQQYGPAGIPAINDLDSHRSQDAGWHLLQTIVERDGAPDQDGNPTKVSKTALDILLDHAFPMFGEGGSQATSAEDALAGEDGAQGANADEDQARADAVLSALQDGTGIPLWEKDRAAREGASLQLHLDATPLYTVTGWQLADSNARLNVPLIARDAQKRYLAPQLSQRVLVEAFATAYRTAAGDGLSHLTLAHVRAALEGMVQSEFGDNQQAALSLYLKFFNGQADAASSGFGQTGRYLRVHENGVDVTPVSFYEAVRPAQAGSTQVASAQLQPGILESYASEYQRALSELTMFYQSARRVTALDASTLDGLKLTGDYGLSQSGKTGSVSTTRGAARANKEKAMSRENVAAKLLTTRADGTVGVRPGAIASLKGAEFEFAPTVEQAPDAVVLTYQGKPLLRWQLTSESSRHLVTGLPVSELPVTEQAGVYAKLLQLAGIEVDASTLAQAMQDSRGGTRRNASVLGYGEINAQLPRLVTKLWSQALAMHLQAQTPEQQQAHPAASIVLHPGLERADGQQPLLLDAREVGGGTAGNSAETDAQGKEVPAAPQLIRSPLAAWPELQQLHQTLAAWAQGGEQSSVKTAEGSAKHLFRLATSKFPRLRELSVAADQLRKAVLSVPTGQAKATALHSFTDAGLGWAGTAAGQPASWANNLATGATKLVGAVDLNVLENPLTGQRQSLVKSSRGELHDAAAWLLFWGRYAETGGDQVALLNSAKADKTSQDAHLLEAGVNQLTATGGSAPAPLVYTYGTDQTRQALASLYDSYLAQFYGSIVPRWQQHGGFVKPANFEQLPVTQAIGLLENHRNAQSGQQLKRSALRSGVDYYKTGISPQLTAVLTLGREGFTGQVEQSILGEAQQLIDQGMTGVPEKLWKELRKNNRLVAAVNYDPAGKFKAPTQDNQENREPLRAADGSYHPLLLDYLVSYRLHTQHLDTALTGHSIFYPKGVVAQVKRGVLNHTAYEAPDVSNPRGLPRYGKVVVFDDLTMAGTHAGSGHASGLRAALRGLGWSEQQITKKLAETVNQDGLGFINPLEWRLLRESEGHKYPLREQIKRIQGGMMPDGTPFMFKNSDLTLSNQLLLLGSETTWNMLAQSLGGYESPLYQRWLELRRTGGADGGPMSEAELLNEKDWDALHQQYISEGAHGETINANSIFSHHVGRLVLLSGNKVAPHSVQDPNARDAHTASFLVDNLLGGRVLSLYQNPDLAQATIANITQENHNLVAGGDNYQAMQRIYDALGSLADEELNGLMAKVQAAAEADGQDGRSYFYEQAVASLTALGTISNQLSLTRYGTNENVPLVTRQITGAIAAALNKALKPRMSGLRATVATVTGLVPMYDVEQLVVGADGNVVAQQTGRLTQQQVLRKGYATLSDGTDGPATLQWAEGYETSRRGELHFTRLLDGQGQPVSEQQTERFIALTQRAMEGDEAATQQMEAQLSEHGYQLGGQEILVPRETASQFGLDPSDDVTDVNEAGSDYFYVRLIERVNTPEGQRRLQANALRLLQRRVQRREDQLLGSSEWSEAGKLAADMFDEALAQSLADTPVQELSEAELLQLAQDYGVDVQKVRMDVVEYAKQNASRQAEEIWQNWQQFLRPKSTRVPHTGMNSTQMSQVVGFLTGHGNTVLVPSEGEIVAGFDSDGDQTNVEFAETRRGGLSVRSGSPAALRQQIFQDKKSVFTNPRNFNQLLKPLTSDDIMDLAKAADSEAQQAREQLYGATQGFHAHGANIEAWTNAQDGKSGVGPAVKVRETFNNLYLVARQNPALGNFAVPSYFDGQTYASITGRVAAVLDYFEQLANGALDNAKNNTLGPLNINEYTLGAYGAAGVMGWSLEQATRVLNHPAFREIVRRTQAGNSIYTSKKERVRLVSLLFDGLLQANPGLVPTQYVDERSGRLRTLSRVEQQQEMVRALSKRHAQQNEAASFLTGSLALEHAFLLTVKGEDLLKLQRVLSPMSGVDSSDFDAQNQLTKLAEVFALPPGELHTVRQLPVSAKGAGNTIMDPLAVLQANKFAGAGLDAMLLDEQQRAKGQLVRQPVVQQQYFKALRELNPEANTFAGHGKLTAALNQNLDADFVRALGTLPVPAGVLETETDPALKPLLKALHGAQLSTAPGRHTFVAALSNLLYQLKVRGRQEGELLGGLGASPLVQALEFDTFADPAYGTRAKLARATELSLEVKNLLERKFSELSRLAPDGHGAYLQRALVVYQLLGTGLVMGRGSLAEVFSPEVLASYSDDRIQRFVQAKAGQRVLGDERLSQVLTRENNLVAQVFPKRDGRMDAYNAEYNKVLDEKIEDLLMQGVEQTSVVAEAQEATEKQMESKHPVHQDEQEAENRGLEDEARDEYIDAEAAKAAVADHSLYYAASEQLPAVLSPSRVSQGLEGRNQFLLKKGQLQLVRVRNKAARGNVLYQAYQTGEGEQRSTQWVRQFPVGNSELNLYGTPLLSPYPVYPAQSVRENLDPTANENLRLHLDKVAAYVKTNKLERFVAAHPRLRVMDRYGNSIEQDVALICK